jgi:hypothetical protein
VGGAAAIISVLRSLGALGRELDCQLAGAKAGDGGGADAAVSAISVLSTSHRPASISPPPRRAAPIIDARLGGADELRRHCCCRPLRPPMSALLPGWQLPLRRSEDIAVEALTSANQTPITGGTQTFGYSVRTPSAPAVPRGGVRRGGALVDLIVAWDISHALGLACARLTIFGVGAAGEAERGGARTARPGHGSGGAPAALAAADLGALVSGAGRVDALLRLVFPFGLRVYPVSGLFL